MNRFINLLLILFISASITYASTKTFVKEAFEQIKSNQTQEEVIEHLKQSLTTQATQEAGVFVQSELKIEDGQITKEEINNIAGSVSKLEVLEIEPFIKDKQQYVKLKAKIEIDTTSVEKYLDKVKQNNKEVSKLKEEIEALKEKLSTASSKETKSLSTELELLLEQQKQMQLDRQQMALEAKEEYEKLISKQKQKDIERQKEFNELQNKIELEQLEAQQQIDKEKEKIKQQAIENKTKIQQLEDNSRKNIVSFNNVSAITIQDVTKDVNKLQKEIDKVLSKYNDLLQSNKKEITKSYDKQIEIVQTRKFLEVEPEQNDNEDLASFKYRLKEYNNKKKEFDLKTKVLTKSLNNSKKTTILKDEIDTLESMTKTTQPFIAKIKQYQTKKYKNNKTIKVKSVEKFNKATQSFYINFKYDGNQYSKKIDCSQISVTKMQVMYDTYKQFIIEPSFSIEKDNNNKYIQKLLCFEVRHLGTDFVTTFDIAKVKEIKDSSFYEEIMKNISNTSYLKESITRNRTIL